MVAIAVAVAISVWYSRHQDQEIRDKQARYVACMQTEGYADALNPSVTGGSPDIAGYLAGEAKCKKLAGIG